MTEDLPKLGRLTKRPEFLFVRDGKYAPRQSLVIQTRKREDDNPQIRFGVTATKKIGNAVTRNKAKRRMREIARACLPKLGQAGHDYVLIARNDTAHINYSQLMLDAEKALEKLARPRHNPRQEK